jgi:hypothetical protein
MPLLKLALAAILPSKQLATLPQRLSTQVAALELVILASQLAAQLTLVDSFLMVTLTRVAY